MPRRSDTRFGSFWIARTLPAVLTGLALLGALPDPAKAQILGNQTPGTPGALDGEFRPARPASAPPAPNAAGLRGPDPDLVGPAASSRFGLKRNPNPAAKRQLGSGQTRPGGFPGASPTGGNPGVSANPTLRSPRDLTATRLGSLPDPAAAAPPLGRPGVPYSVAPGLPTPATPVPRRAPREDDPYAPLGIRARGFILRPAIEISGGYDTNAARSATAARGSPLYRTEGELAATSDWTRHQLDLSLRGAYTGYTAIDNANRPEGDVRAALRLDATRDLALEAALSARVDTENPTNVNLPAGTSKRVPYYNFGTALGATQRFGRLSIGLRGTLDRALYSDVESGGVTVSQESRNLVTYGLRLRAGYEVTPGITPFAEIGLDNRVHDLAVDAGGFRRDSRGVTLRAGSTFELARNLTGEAGAGYTFRHYEDARLAYLRAPVIDAALTWSASPLTTLNLRAQSEIVETTLANSAGGIAYRGTMTLTHAFLRNFTATATLGLSRTDYEGVNRVETGLNAGMRLEYRFNRLVALRGSYAFERLTVNTPGENYQAHTFLLGMRLTR
ncbi:MAG: outer membrane beta-barrel protein [Beijerinckiaceae bacterium]|nr:outer membrane beta-barrel protein [Beijerinckiaceae bacterium]MCZ8300929.1 outer membrane beta-barrel protein [Beijerinckiaceae bacterium]